MKFKIFNKTLIWNSISIFSLTFCWSIIYYFLMDRESIISLLIFVFITVSLNIISFCFINHFMLNKPYKIIKERFDSLNLDNPSNITFDNLDQIINVLNALNLIDENLKTKEMSIKFHSDTLNLYKEQFDKIDFPIFQLDVNGCFINNNTNCLKIMNIAALTINDSLFDFISEANLNSIKVSFLKFIESPAKNYSFICKLLIPNSVSFWAKINLFKIIKEDSSLILLGIITDINELKLNEIKLNKSYEEIKESNSTKSIFIANVSHELRTPLNAITGLSELIINTKLEPTQRKFIQTILDSSKSMLSLINDIIDYSKIDSGKINIDLTTVDITDLVESSLELFATKANSKNIYFMSYIPNDIPLVVTDYKKIKQILLNLISNALKFTENGEVIVTVSIVEESDTKILFEVIDTGIGLSKESSVKVFEPFYQVRESLNKEGTGLGLAISNKLIRTLNGSIGVVSDNRLGSTFWVLFPVEISDQTLPKPKQELFFNKDISVLILCDSKKINYIITNYLESLDLKTIHIENLNNLKETMNRNFYNIIIFDLIYESKESIANAINYITVESIYTKIIILANLLSQISEYNINNPANVSLIHRPIKYSALILSLNNLYKNTTPPTIIIPPSKSVTKKKGLILIVEDTPANMLLITAQLDQLGYSYECVNNGLESVNFYIKQYNQVSLILMDCQLPELDGYEATYEIRTFEKSLGIRTPIIAVTANAMNNDREKCIINDMDDYLPKPVTLDNLSTLLEKWTVKRPITK